MNVEEEAACWSVQGEDCDWSAVLRRQVRHVPVRASQRQVQYAAVLYQRNTVHLI